MPATFFGNDHNEVQFMMTPDASQSPSANPNDPGKQWEPLLFVWGVWLASFALVLTFIYQYAVDVPYTDDWEIVPALTGNRNWVRYLFERHNEHFLPLPKLLLLGLLHMTDWDFRAGIVFNTIALGALSAAMISTANRLRGYMSYADAYFPLTILSLGHFANIFVSWQVQMISSVLLSGIFLLIIVRAQNQLTFRAGMAAGLCVALLPLCGANGLLVAPAFSAWLLYVALVSWRLEQPGCKKLALVLFICTAVAWAEVAYGATVSFAHTALGPKPELFKVISVAVQFLSVSFGLAIAQPTWPLSGIWVVLFTALSAGLLLVRWVGQPYERTRIIGLIFFLSGIVTLAFGLAWGRAGQSPIAGFVDRYFALAALLICCLFFIWGIYGRPSTATVVQMTLFTLASVPVIANVRQCQWWLDDLSDKKTAFRQDMLNSTPLSKLAAGHVRLYNPKEPEASLVLLRSVRQFGRAGRAPYDRVPDDVAEPAVFVGLVGSIDEIRQDFIAGWALNGERPTEPVKLEIYDGDTLLATVDADQFRMDLFAAGIGNGRHSFQIPTPEKLKDGQPHIVHVIFAETHQEVPGSPKQFAGN